ncbi:MAG TPA: hypothetical protein VFZ21_28295 [Gemmatimonadaceae bacterium]|nr:hypothetical protein [Gemmatimonadaceae bacterium]
MRNRSTSPARPRVRRGATLPTTLHIIVVPSALAAGADEPNGNPQAIS